MESEKEKERRAAVFVSDSIVYLGHALGRFRRATIGHYEEVDRTSPLPPRGGRQFASPIKFIALVRWSLRS